MAKRTRWNHSPTFKAQVAIAAHKGEKTLAELAQHFDVNPNHITDWKTQLQEISTQVYRTAPAKLPDPDIETIRAKIGQLTLENDLFWKIRSPRWAC